MIKNILTNEIKCLFLNKLVKKDFNIELEKKLNDEERNILFNIGLPNSDDLDFEFTVEIIFKESKQELILETYQGGYVAFNLKSKQVYRIIGNTDKIIFNSSLKSFLLCIYYYELFLFEKREEKKEKEKKKILENFKSNIHLAEPLIDTLDYYWGAIIEEYETGALLL